MCFSCKARASFEILFLLENPLCCHIMLMAQSLSCAPSWREWEKSINNRDYEKQTQNAGYSTGYSIWTFHKWEKCRAKPNRTVRAREQFQIPDYQNGRDPTADPWAWTLDWGIKTVDLGGFRGLHWKKVACSLWLDNVIEVSITFLGRDDGIVVLWESVLVLRKCRPRSPGVKCCAACHFGMIQKIEIC